MVHLRPLYGFSSVIFRFQSRVTLHPVSSGAKLVKIADKEPKK
jgi:hypothetical protein